jgi:hypothetical protein
MSRPLLAKHGIVLRYKNTEQALDSAGTISRFSRFHHAFTEVLNQTLIGAVG